MATHVRVVAILFLVFGGMLAVAGLVASLFFGGVGSLAGTSADDGALLAALVLRLTGVALTLLLIAVALPCLIAGWGLLKTRPWARTLGIVLAAISIVNFWIGTAFGVYALWVLLNKRSEDLFGD